MNLETLLSSPGNLTAGRITPFTTMKRQVRHPANLFIMFLAAQAFFACNSDDDAAGGRAEVKFSASAAEIQTRVADDKWEINDRVGIYMIGAAGGLTSGNIVEGADNRQYSASADGAGAKSFAPEGGAIYYPMNGNVAFIAYHPYAASVPADFRLPVSVATQSNQSAIDVLYAPKTTGVYNRSTNPVDLRFEHKLVKLTLNVTQGDGVTGTAGTLASMTVNITGQQTATTLDLANGAIAVATGGPKNITAKETANYTSSAKYEAIVLPNSSVSGMTFTFATKHMGTFEVAVPAPTGRWLSGYQYDYNVTMERDEVVITGSVGNWTTGNTYPVTGASPSFLIEGYAGNIEIQYTDGLPVTVKSITLTDYPGNPLLIGRAVDPDNPISLKFDGSGDLLFRDAVGGSIPIGSYAEFQKIRDNGTDKKYRLEADLDLMSEEWTPIANDTPNHYDFYGEFDGAGKKISNLKITGANDKGLFRANRGTIRNVHIVSGTISAGSYSGAISGHNQATGSIISCSNAATFTGGSRVGGMTGNNINGVITACYNTGKVTGSGNTVGGIAGYNEGGAVTACYNTGTVSGGSSVVGNNNGGTVTACYWKSGTATNGIGSGSGGVTMFTDYFNPTGSLAWGTGTGEENGWWKAGTTNNNTLPKLWFE